jgi:hypothetical protein
MMPHTAGTTSSSSGTVAMYFRPQPVVDLREFLPDHDEATPPIKMGDGEAPVVPEFKHFRVVCTVGSTSMLT